SYLKANAHDDSGRIPYNYSTTVNWQAYSRVMVDPATVYNGADNQFGEMSDADRATLATYLQKSFTQKLETRFASAAQPGPGTLRVKLILTGAETTT
ncbi:DUF3313 family protein, partial [Paraburkholderia sp. EG285A]